MKLGGAATIDKAAKDLHQLSGRVSTGRAGGLALLMVITGGRYCYERPDGVAVVPLACFGH